MYRSNNPRNDHLIIGEERIKPNLQRFLEAILERDANLAKEKVQAALDADLYQAKYLLLA